MPDEFTISQLPTTPSFNNLDLMEIAQVDEDSVTGYSSYKKTMNQIGDKINNSIEYSADLNTTNKKIIGAINEVNAKGLKDLSDTTINNPSNNQVLSYSGGKWKNGGAVNVKDDITWNETTASGTGAYRVANMMFITYQGENKTHANGDTLFVLPTALRPIQNWEQSFTVDGKTFGQVHVLSNGNVNINSIADNTQSGRIYFSVAYPIT